MDSDSNIESINGASDVIRISIAMATYNGETYLKEQFESLFTQTRLPDEVVVYDDASGDGTLSLLRDLKMRAPFPVKIISGTENVGVNAAFGMALEACRGDYFFFCDQDDIWEPQKIAKFMPWFEDHDAVGLVFCDTSQIDPDGNGLRNSLWKQISFDKKRRQRFERRPLAELLRGGNFIYGMATAFRTESIRTFCPINADPRGMTHDTWFALHVMATGWKAVALDEKLVRYRRHGRQTTKKEDIGEAIGSQARKAARRVRINVLIEAMQRIEHNIATTPPKSFKTSKEEALRQITLKISHLMLREHLRDSRNPFLALRASISLGYWKFAKGPVSVLRDLRGL